MAARGEMEADDRSPRSPFWRQESHRSSPSPFAPLRECLPCVYDVPCGDDIARGSQQKLP